MLSYQYHMCLSMSALLVIFIFTVFDNWNIGLRTRNDWQCKLAKLKHHSISIVLLFTITLQSPSSFNYLIHFHSISLSLLVSLHSGYLPAVAGRLPILFRCTPDLLKLTFSGLSVNIWRLGLPHTRTRVPLWKAAVGIP